MKYLPILEELFSSDSIIFLLIGLVIAFGIGLGLKSVKKIAIGMIASIIIYALCELISNIIATFLVAIITLFIGTVAIGCFIGFLIALIVLKIRGNI